MKQHDLITALRARGRSDALAQAAADEIERLQGLAVPAPTQAPTPDGFIITEKVREDDAKAKWQAERNRSVKQRMDAMPVAAKKAPAKTAKRK